MVGSARSEIDDLCALGATDRRDLNRWVGTELTGLRTQDLDEADSVALRRLVSARGVVLLRGQDLDVEQLVEFSRRLGDVVPHPTTPHPEHPLAFRLVNDGSSAYADGDNWHADLSWMDSPPLYSVLMLDNVPVVGGDTAFTSTSAVLRSVSAPFVKFLSGLRAVHQRTWLDQVLGTEHPLLVEHPVSGETCLYANSGYTTSIVGLHLTESNAVLAHLKSVVGFGVDFQCRASWEPGTVAVWDNQSVQHHASWDYHPEARSGWRVTAGASKPTAVTP
jgi:taurine dioxygenase